ncbi:TIGR03084 family metal-binding protein [Nocardia brasiliensis]
MLDYGFDLSEVKRELALTDLIAEGDALDDLVSAAADWSTPTPAAGWTIAHQIAHLAAADANVLTAIRAPESFDDVLRQTEAAGGRQADLDAAAGAAQPRSTLLRRWRTGRHELATALGDLPPERPFPWFGSEVTAALMVPLRLLETWAHGQDVFDALDVAHPPTNRLRYVAFLGVLGRELSFYAAGLPTPTASFRVELTGPDGDEWAWGPDGATQRIRGSALDFCLRATQRRPLAETGLSAVGPDAQRWLEIARAFL